MALLQARIDDRLIHGQVVVGCCGPLGARLLILCHDEVAGDALRKRIYAAAVPPEIDVEILTLVDAASRISALEPELRDRALLVVGSCSDMQRLVEAGAPILEVTVGGLHHRPGTEELWPGFFLDGNDTDALRALLDRGVKVESQSVPGVETIEVSSRLGAPPESSS